MSYNLTIDRDKFTKLLNIIKLFENHCTDCDIQNGRIRQKSNDRNLVFDVDVSAIMETKDLTLTSVKNKMGLLKAYELDDNVQLENKNVLIESNDSNYEFKDPFTLIALRKPATKLIDNQYMKDEEFNALINIKEENLLFSTVISNYLKKRISSICEGFTSEVIKCEIDGLTAKTYVISSDKQNTLYLEQAIQLNRSVPKSNFTFLSTPFKLDIVSDLKISCYLHNDIVVIKYEQVYYGTTVIIYGRSKVVQ